MEEVVSGRIRRSVYSFLALIALVAGGCTSTSRVDTMNVRSSSFYAPGLPYFTVDPDIEEHASPDSSTVVLRLSIANASLTFLKAGDHFVARYDILCRVFLPDGERPVYEGTWADTVTEATYAGTQVLTPVHVAKRFPLAPGKYEVQVALQDNDTRKMSSRWGNLHVPSLVTQHVGLGMLHVDIRDSKGGYEPIGPVYGRLSPDSLRVGVSLLTLAPGGEATAEFILAQFTIDTSVASPPFTFSPFAGTFTFRGVDYEHPDTMMIGETTVEVPARSTHLEFYLPPLGEGMYLVTTRIRYDSTTLTQKKLFTIRAADFPRPTTLGELIEELRYLASDNEMTAIDTVRSPLDRKRAFDHFWLSRVRTESAAANVLKLYYTRVQEANMFFTCFKEGWKTDRGMVYIVLGPPGAVERRFDLEIWRYSSADQDAPNTYVFKRSSTLAAESPFDNFVLQRQNYYERSWDRAIERWRAGAAF